MRKIFLGQLVLLFAACFAVSIGDAQVPALLEPSGTSNCEHASAMVDSFLSEQGKEREVIIVASKGTNEISDRYATRRLREVQRYLTVYHHRTRLGIPAEHLILSTGIEKEPVPQLKLFMNGTLKLILQFRNKKNLALLPCAMS